MHLPIVGERGDGAARIKEPGSMNELKDSYATAHSDAAAFNRRTLVIDFLGMYYLLEERYAERALAAGVNAVNVTFGGEGTWDAMLQSIEGGLERIAKSNLLALACSADDIAKAQSQGKLAIIMGTQGTSVLGEDLWRLRILHLLGLRVVGLNGSFGNLFGAGSAETGDAGVTFLGRDLIEIINGLGMMLDLSHCGHRTTHDAIALARAPVCSHANAFAIEPTDRNRKDDDIVAMAQKGGVIGICALPRAVKERSPNLQHLLDHLDHVISLVGSDHVGIGLDLMEGYRENKTSSPGMMRRRTLRPDIFGTVEDYYNDDLPEGLSSISQLANLTAGLLERAHSEAVIANVLGGSWFAAFKKFVG
jgi:membrane dipeptidase